MVAPPSTPLTGSFSQRHRAAMTCFFAPTMVGSWIACRRFGKAVWFCGYASGFVVVVLFDMCGLYPCCGFWRRWFQPPVVIWLFHLLRCTTICCCWLVSIMLTSFWSLKVRNGLLVGVSMFWLSAHCPDLLRSIDVKVTVCFLRTVVTLISVSIFMIDFGLIWNPRHFICLMLYSRARKSHVELVAVFAGSW